MRCARLKRPFAAGYECVFIGDRIEGEARDVAAEHARLVRDLRANGRRAVVLSGGELTVTVRGKGRGGPNQEYALALAMALAGMPAVAAIAADTDGTDGGAGAPSDPAGALIDGDRLFVPKRLASIPPPSRGQQLRFEARGTYWHWTDLHQR